MPSYPRLAGLVTGPEFASQNETHWGKVIPYLVDVWLIDYDKATSRSDIVETRSHDFSYLFDVASERLISAWGISRGKSAAPRPKSRMRGHPLSDGPLYHRGHAIPHSLGGPTDINLVPQLGSVNIGPFKVLESRAVATPGSLYFTYWIYGNSSGQRPHSVEQGLLCPGQSPRIHTHSN